MAGRSTEKRINLEDLKGRVLSFILTRDNKDELVSGLIEQATFHGWKLNILDDMQFFLENQMKYPSSIENMLSIMTKKFGKRYFPNWKKRMLTQMMMDMSLDSSGGNIFSSLGKSKGKSIPVKPSK